MELQKLNFLVVKNSREDIAEQKFATTVAIYFLRIRAKRESEDGVVLKSEKAKNIYLARNFYKKAKARTLEITFEDPTKEDAYYQRMQDIDFWKSIVDFMFNYADSNILAFYSQTVNGLFSFYFKHYHRIKKTLDSKNLDAASRQLQALVRKWSREEAVKVFYLYLVKLYYHFHEDKSARLKQEYYSYIKFIDSSCGVPKIKAIVLENSPYIRGLLMDFSPAFSEWMVKWDLDIDKVFNYVAFSELCESGVTYIPNVANKGINDVLYDALTAFVENFE